MIFSYLEEIYAAKGIIFSHNFYCFLLFQIKSSICNMKNSFSLLLLSDLIYFLDFNLFSSLMFNVLYHLSLLQLLFVLLYTIQCGMCVCDDLNFLSVNMFAYMYVCCKYKRKVLQIPPYNDDGNYNTHQPGGPIVNKVDKTHHIFSCSLSLSRSIFFNFGFFFAIFFFHYFVANCTNMWHTTLFCFSLFISQQIKQTKMFDILKKPLA